MSIQKRKNGTLVTVAGLPNIDQILSADSRNAVENRTIYNALRLKVERTVNDLANYYLKSETYAKEEVEALIATISTMTMKIVTALPETDISTTTIYLVKSGTNSYDEYIYVDGVWAKIGSTEINLEDYYTKTEVDELLNNLVTDVIIDVSVLPTSEIQNIIYRIVNEDNETEYYAGDADNQTTEQLAKRSDVTRTWTGTTSAWNSLSSSEKEKYEIVNLTDDTNPNGKFVDITSQCTVVLGTAKVMKCGQIVVINGYVPKVSGSNGYREVVKEVPVSISNGTSNSAVGNALNSSTQSTRIIDSTLRVYCSTATETNYSIMYLTDE